VDQDYLRVLCISSYSTSSLMSDFMGYHELGGIGFEARMESFRRLERILKNMDYEYICLILLYKLLLNEVHMTMQNILYELRVF